MNYTKITENAVGIELKIESSTSQQIDFRTIEELRDRKVDAIEIVPPVMVGTSNSGLNPVPLTELQSSFLDLEADGRMVLKNFPLTALFRSNNNGEPFRIRPTRISSSNSKIRTAAGTTYTNPGQVAITMVIYFEDIRKNNLAR